MTKKYRLRNIRKELNDEIQKLVDAGKYPSKDAFVNEAVEKRLQQVKVNLKERSRIIDVEAAVLRKELKCFGAVEQ